MGLHDVLDRYPFALGDDVLAKRELFVVEGRLHPIHYIIYSALAEQGYQQASEEAGQPSSLSRLWDVSLAAMLPLPNLGGNEEAVEEEDNSLLQPFEPLLPGNLVEGENIDVDALMHLDMSEG